MVNGDSQEKMLFLESRYHHPNNQLFKNCEKLAGNSSQHNIVGSGYEMLEINHHNNLHKEELDF